MPQFDTSAPRGNFKFYDQAVTLPLPYAAGHALTEAEAKFINQQIATATGNRYGAAIRRALDNLNDERAKAAKAKTYDGPMDESGKKPAPATVADLGWDHQAEIEDIYTNFEPGVSNRGGKGGASSTDPVESEIRRLAGVAVRDLYKAKGIKYKDALTQTKADGRSAYSHHVDDYIAARGDQLRSIVEAQFSALAATKDVNISMEG